MSAKGFAILLVLFFFSPNGILAHKPEGISYPSLRFTSKIVKTQIADDKNEKIAILKGDVHFEFRGVAEFFSDKISFGLSKEKKN